MLMGEQGHSPIEERLKSEGLYSEDLAPVPPHQRTWNKWHLAALWVGMAVCIPTYLLAAGMIGNGIPWWMALLIIGVANLIITLPMVLNGHAGVRYGVPFPVLGRAAFGVHGIHIPAIIRAFVACGWFGVQTWIGGLAIYAMWCAVTGMVASPDLDLGKFIGFAVFWLINLYFIWNGTESIKWLENLSAPILILTGILLIVWGAWQASGFGVVLEQSKQLELPAGKLMEEGDGLVLRLNPLRDRAGAIKADSVILTYPFIDGGKGSATYPILGEGSPALRLPAKSHVDQLKAGQGAVEIQYKALQDGKQVQSSQVAIRLMPAAGVGSYIWEYLIWLTVMVGFWATMSISIADVTRFARSQGDQVAGQFIGLPGTMVLYSFVGIFVTCAAVINFEDILVNQDAPWNPVDLLSRFESPVVVVLAQIFMLIATLTTNIAANVIAPANAFANLFPKHLSYRSGGLLTALIGIAMCPWWVMNDISPILLFVSGLLGPVLGVLISDYFLVRRRHLDLNGLFDPQGPYQFNGGFNVAAFVSMGVGMALALIGLWVPALSFLYSLSWFTGFAVSLFLYWILMRTKSI